MSEYCIIGHRGFIGSALAKVVGEFTTYPTEDTKYIFYMAGVVHPVFEKNPEWYAAKEKNEFVHLLTYSLTHNIKLLYCSSALVSEGKDSEFVKSKKTLENLGANLCMGFRIFPVYGPGDHNTVITQWCKQIKNDEQPVVYGDGSQRRDFIFVDDVARIIFENRDRKGVMEVGTGIPASFNSIIDAINGHLGKNIKPVYVEAPPDYSEGIYCKEGLEIKVSLMEGIKKICEAL